MDAHICIHLCSRPESFTPAEVIEVELMAFVIALLLAAGLHGATAVEQQQQATANPIRMVVNMLQALQAKVKAEGDCDGSGKRRKHLI